MAGATKVWDRNRPFVRINSPSANARTRLSGLGHDDAGTRRQGDYAPSRSVLEALVISRLIALTPSWARTIGNTEAQGEQEVFGKLQRSFQTWTDAPPGQWHTWYDWNFHIEPESEFQWLRGLGNTDTFKKADTDRFEAVVQGRCMELEWDTGGFGTAPGAMFNTDWAWPMTDDFLWAAGRSIYDGGHEHEAEEAQEETALHRALTQTEVLNAAVARNQQAAATPPAPKDLLTRSELHPCKAIASARFEAHTFPGTKRFVPAIQFMFFASKLGGYKRFTTLTTPDGKNYEFIVDLPPPSGVFTPQLAPIGATPDFPFNRIVLREEPLVDFDFSRFDNAAGTPAPASGRAKFAPLVEILPEGANPNQRQAKVTIPINEFAAAFPTADFYGVLVSLGWPDADDVQAKHVKKCTITFDRLQKATLDHDTFAEEWRFKVGVNGRWFQFEFNDMHDNTVQTLGRSVVMHLHEDDFIRVSAHGAELDLVDDVYLGPRTITVSPLDIAQEVNPNANADTTQRPVVWETDVDISPLNLPGPLPAPKFGTGSQPVQRAICQKIFDLMFSTFNDQNDPLGLIDAGRGSIAEKAFNPMQVSQFIKKFGEKNEKPFSLKGLRTEEVGDSAELVAVQPDLARPSDLDYTLHYKILVEPQDGL